MGFINTVLFMYSRIMTVKVHDFASIRQYNDALHFQLEGPTHVEYAMSCLNHVMTYNFEHGDMFLTIVTSSNMTSPAFEIQRDIIRRINILGRWKIEIIKDFRYEFKSSQKCKGKMCINHFIPNMRSQYYLMIIDDKDRLEEKIDILLNTKSYNSSSIFLIYYSQMNADVIIFEEIFNTIWKRFLHNVVLLMPKTVSEISIYRLKVNIKSPMECSSQPQFVKCGVCQKGKLPTNPVPNLEINKLENCTIKAISMKYEPFVINQTRGMEIELLEHLAKYLNMSVILNISEDTRDWGTKQNDTWDEKLGVIYNESWLGIGNVDTTAEGIQDFDFTIDYLSVRLVWLVPIAKPIPKWRVLTVIFTLHLWAICFGVFIATSFLLYVASLKTNELRNMKSLRNTFLISLQIIINVAVPTHPITGLTRVIFLSATIYSLIMSSVYTSALINILTRTVREHQINSVGEILNSGFDIGGLGDYKDIFELPNTESQQIFDVFKLNPDENDTAQIWLEAVAKGHTCTLLNKLYVQYFMSLKNPMITDSKGKPKVHIVNGRIFSYNLSIVMKKGFPYLRIFDLFIFKALEHGIVDGITKKYTHKFKRLKQIEADDDNVPESLSTDNLQGAFAILIFGYVSGAIVLVIEAMVEKVNRWKSEKKNLKMKPNKIIVGKNER